MASRADPGRGAASRTDLGCGAAPRTDPGCGAASRPDFDPNTGDDLLEAESIMQGVVQRRRRVFGPTHPHTRHCEGALTSVRARLARA